MRITINHREDQPVAVGGVLRVPVQNTNVWGETLDYTALSIIVREVIATVPSDSISPSDPGVLQTTIEGEFYLDLQYNRD